MSTAKNVIIAVSMGVIGAAFLFISWPVQAQDASVTTPQETVIDDRFVPIGGLPTKLIEQIEAGKKISISIDGAKLRSEVDAGIVTVNGWDSKEKKVTTDPNMIRVKENLYSYAKAIVLNDANISSLSIQERSIVIKYQVTGKLFWFIPVRIMSSIELLDIGTNTDGAVVGTIRMKYPWYHLLIKKSISARKVADEFAAQLAILNSVDDTQKIAQYLSIISAILKK
jgi:hypothetical protein